MGKSAKGGIFEREFCTQLSLWWTYDKHDDVFWRSSNSGGRATTRGKTGKNTRGQYGDVAATHPSGQGLLRQVVFELKRGYSGDSFHDLLDVKPHLKLKTFELFLHQTIQAQMSACTPYWCLVTRRDLQCTVMWFPRALFRALRQEGAWPVQPWPFMSLAVRLRHKDKARTTTPLEICAMSADGFFAGAQPEHFKRLLRDG